VKKHSNKSITRSPDEPISRKVKAKEPVHSHSVIYETPETPTPPLSPVSSAEASPVANINVVHRNASKDYEHEEGVDMDTISDEERTMFSDITDNRSHFPGDHTSPKTSPAPSPNRDKSNKNRSSNDNYNNTGPQKNKVRASIDADAVGGTGVTGITTGATVMSAKPNLTDAPVPEHGGSHEERMQPSDRVSLLRR
jgi:hypothetical protein